MSKSPEGLAPTGPTIGGLVREIAARFESAGLDSPRLDARILVAHVLGFEPNHVFTKSDEVFDAATRRDAEKLVKRRLAHEPVSRIIGTREFWGLEFVLAPETLDPRPDTETLVSAALEFMPYFNRSPVRVLDLGTGTGCILLAILSEWPDAIGLGVDISEGAVAAATANAARLGIAQRAEFRAGSWAEGVTDVFDVVVSNPPYIAEGERSHLSAEVAEFDPPMALFGGVDGLAAYRAMLPSARRIIAPGGRIIIEIGSGQATAVTELLGPAGFEIEAQKNDIAQIVRCLVAQPT